MKATFHKIDMYCSKTGNTWGIDVRETFSLPCICTLHCMDYDQ